MEKITWVPKSPIYFSLELYWIANISRHYSIIIIGESTAVKLITKSLKLGMLLDFLFQKYKRQIIRIYFNLTLSNRRSNTIWHNIRADLGTEWYIFLFVHSA